MQATLFHKRILAVTLLLASSSLLASGQGISLEGALGMRSVILSCGTGGGGGRLCSRR